MIARAKRFRYALDPLCVAAIALYVANRWLVLPHVEWRLLHFHFNDLLLIPAALPPVLWLQRRLGLRTHDGAPTLVEIAFHTVVWSVVCEIVGPALTPRRGDPLDVLAYAAGACLAAAVWRSSPHVR